MLKVRHNGAEGFISQLICTNDAEPGVVSMSICGREITVRALVAHFLEYGEIPVKMGDRSVFLTKIDKFNLKGKKISPQYYQVMLWSNDRCKSVIRKKDFANFIENRYSVPFHSAWADCAWRFFIEREMIDLLKGYGVNDTFYDVHFAEETLQSFIIGNIDQLKALLKKAA